MQYGEKKVRVVYSIDKTVTLIIEDDVQLLETIELSPKESKNLAVELIRYL